MQPAEVVYSLNTIIFLCFVSPESLPAVLRIFDVDLDKRMLFRGHIVGWLQLNSRSEAQEETSPLHSCAPLRLRACPAPLYSVHPARWGAY